jgi:hypothetical protein
LPRPASLDSTNSDFTNESAQQLADSLTVSAVPPLPSLDHELTTQPTPKPRRKAKLKSRPKSKPRRPPAPSSENQALAPDDLHEPTPLERHARKCSICNHPDREYVEEAFLQWRSPDTIMRRWDIKAKTAIYHHAHAFKLFSLRTRNLQLALGNIIEDADTRGFTARDILHAIGDLAHINEDGRWLHPTHKSEASFPLSGYPPARQACPHTQTQLPS